MATEAERHYQQALERLSDLVQRRNQALLQLDTMVSLPLSISPRSGRVAKLDAGAARRLLDQVERQNDHIAQAMETVNQLAAQLGRPRIEWLAMPTLGADLAAADD